jgi:hypothetical protein
MIFSEVVEEVTGIVARPDRETEIRNAVNFVINRCCLSANFARDLVESSIAIDDTLYGDTIDYLAETERFRKFKYVKPYGLKRYLRSIDSDKLFTPGDVMQKNRYYVAGSNMTYTLSDLVASLEIGYYQYPPTLEVGSSEEFWLIDISPYCVIDLAAARLFRSIGDDTSAKAYEASGSELYKVVRRDCEDSILAEAR